MPNLQLHNDHCIKRNPQQNVSYDWIINSVWELQDQCGNQPKPMLADDVEEEDQLQ
jgi:hypothetical protein